MTQQLSNCCKAQVSVSSSDEGTNCFMCVECKRSCDLYSKMKEQISVDTQCPHCKNKFAYESGVLNHIKFKRCKALRERCNHENVELDSLSRIYCVDCNLVNVSNMLQSSKTIVNKSELERLKRLDKNVRRKIAAYERCIDGVFGKDFLVKIELLKSLYDE